jgi:hypothetical protein
VLVLLWDLLTDPAVFRRSLRAGLAGLGLGMQQGVIPTGVDYGGKYGIWLVMAAFLLGPRALPAGDGGRLHRRPRHSLRNRE